MRRFGDFFSKAVSGLNRVEIVVGGGFLLIMVLIIVYGVILRYIFRAPTALSFELSALAMLPSTVLALTYAQREKAHVRVELLTSKLPLKAQLVIEVIAYIVFIAYVVLLTWAGWRLAADHLERNQSSLNAGIPFIWFSVLIPIGLITLCLQLFIDIKDAISRLRSRLNQVEVGHGGVPFKKAEGQE